MCSDSILRNSISWLIRYSKRLILRLKIAASSSELKVGGKTSSWSVEIIAKGVLNSWEMKVKKSNFMALIRVISSFSRFTLAINSFVVCRLRTMCLIHPIMIIKIKIYNVSIGVLRRKGGLILISIVLSVSIIPLSFCNRMCSL